MILIGSTYTVNRGYSDDIDSTQAVYIVMMLTLQTQRSDDIGSTHTV